MSAYNLGTASGRIEIDGKGASAGFKVAETAASTFFDVIQRKVDSIQQMGRRMQVAGASGVAGFGLAINAAANFEKQMSGVKAVAGGTEAQFEQLRQKALQLGADTAFSASEAGLAIEELAKAGIPIEDILNGAADAAVALAAAGGVSLPEAATIASNAMNQFGISSDKVVEVADILAGVANTSAADVSGLGQSLSQAGAVANLAGLSFRDTAIALGEMADAGINGSDAGTSVKTMLNNLIPTTEKQSNKFKELGLLQYDLAKAQKVVQREGLGQAKSMDEVNSKLSKYVDEVGLGAKGTVRNRQEVDKLLMSNGALSNSFFDAQGNIKNLGGLQAELGKALKGLTREQKLSTLETLFGADAMRASAILSLAGAKGYRQFSDAVSKTSAADVAKTRLDNLSGATEAFKGSMETAMITIGNIFLPVVTKVVQGATAIVNAFNSLPGPVKTAIGILAGIVTILLVVVGTILSSLTAIALFVAQWYALRIIGVATGYLRTFIAVQRGGLGIMAAHNAAMATAGARTSRLAKITQIASKVLLVFGRTARAAWIMATGPIGIAVAAIAALVAIGYLLYQRWTPFRNLINQIGAALQGYFTQAWTALQPVIGSVMAAFQRFGSFVQSVMLPVLQQIGAMLVGKLLAGWAAIRDAIMSQLMPAIDRLVAAFQGEIIPAATALVAKIAPMVAAFGRFAAVVGGVLLVALMKVGSIFITYILPILAKVAGFLLGVLIDSVVGFVKAIIQAVTGLVQIFTGLINFFKGLFTGNWSQMWLGVKQIFTGIWNVIIGLLKAYLYVGVLKLVGLAFKGLLRLVLGGWRMILGVFRGAGRGIIAVVKGAFNLIVGAIRLYVRMWSAIIRGGWSLIRSIVSGAVRAVVGFVKAAFNLVVAIIKGQMNTAKAIIQGVWNAIKSAVGKAWNAIVDAVSSGVRNVLDLISSLPGKAVSALGDLGNTLYNAGVSLIGGLARGITAKIGDAINAVQSGLGKIRGLLPGSPIKWGPLKDWNRGGAGKRLMDVLASGLEDTSPIEKAMRSVATYISGVDMMLQPAIAAGPAVTPELTTRAVAPVLTGGARRPRPARARKKESRIVRGVLHIGPDGRVWIEGIAQDVYDENEESKDQRDPRGGRRG